eukprot:TRINITY_DN38579_c0_g2_i1.p1 TRINITY_DN38579_c0_g2~~TRINITY_DN38579_c0_g2_i1.p1  ORF type:complete len:270 (+),score=40.29 TRINITY_DN38579_c0_g2_i1:49-810(+)
MVSSVTPITPAIFADGTGRDGFIVRDAVFLHGREHVPKESAANWCANLRSTSPSSAMQSSSSDSNLRRPVRPLSASSSSRLGQIPTAQSKPTRASSAGRLRQQVAAASAACGSRGVVTDAGDVYYPADGGCTRLARPQSASVCCKGRVVIASEAAVRDGVARRSLARPGSATAKRAEARNSSGRSASREKVPEAARCQRLRCPVSPPRKHCIGGAPRRRPVPSTEFARQARKAGSGMRANRFPTSPSPARVRR